MLFKNLYLLSLSLMCGKGWAWSHSSRDTLQTGLDHEGPVLVAFLDPTQPKTQAFEKEWLSAVRSVKDQLHSLDCYADAAHCAEYGITSYPTLQIFRHGKPETTYLGPRSSSVILNFVLRQSRPVVTVLHEEADIEKFKRSDEVVFIGYISSSDESAQRTFQAIATKYRDEFSFALVTDEDIVQAQNMALPTAVCHVVDDEETRYLNAFADATALDSFVTGASRRVIGELTPYNYQRLHDRGWPMVYLFAETEEERADLRRTLFKSVKGNYESLTCVTVDHLEYPELQAKLGLEPGVFPAGAVHQLSNDRIYPYPRNLPMDSRSLQKWGLDVWQGRVRPWTPPGQTAAPVDSSPRKAATRRVSVANIPGVNIKIGGRDEL